MTTTADSAPTSRFSFYSKLVSVTGVPTGTSEQEVSDAFTQFGEIASVRLNDGTPTVMFKEPGAATAAIAASGKVALGGKNVEVAAAKRARRKGRRSGSRPTAERPQSAPRDLSKWVAVKPVMHNVGREKMCDVMSEFGEVSSMDFRRGITFVEFTTAEGAKAAIAGSQTKYFGDHAAVIEAREPLKKGKKREGQRATGGDANERRAPTRVEVTAQDLYVARFDRLLPTPEVNSALEEALPGVEYITRPRNRAFAFVRMASAEDAKAAVGKVIKVGDAEATVEQRNPRTAPAAPAAASSRATRSRKGKRSNSADGSSIVVMDLPFQIQEEDVQRIFEPFGKIKAIATSAYSAVAHVTLGSEEAAKKAVDAGKVTIAGKEATVLPRIRPRARSEAYGPDTVYVRAISHEASEDDIKAAMAQFGEVKDVTHRVATARAFVDYESPEIASQATSIPRLNLGSGLFDVQIARLAARDILARREQQHKEE